MKKSLKRLSVLAVTPAAGLILGLAVTGSTVASAATVHSTATVPQVKPSVATTRPVYAAAPATATPAAATCKPNEAFRFLACGRTPFTDTFYVDNKVVGRITFLLQQTDQLAVKSTAVTESDEIYDIKVSGEVLPTAVATAATCGANCTGSAHGSVALVPGATYRFDLHFSNSVGAGAVHFNAPAYRWVFSSGGEVTGGGLQWRCDDKLNEHAGCVYPIFHPTITSLAGLKFIAASIKRIQARGGPKELHRNSFLTTANRNAVCNIKLPPGWKPPAGWPLPITDPKNKPTCDEYPFAASWEGGKRLPASQRGTAWVPASENSSQGGLLNAFYLQNRVLDATSAKTKGDAFNVGV